MPQQISLIRHGEKPAAPAAAPFGVDASGNTNPHSLTPRGWQRCGALAGFFDPTVGAPESGLRIPTALYAPDYTDTEKTQNHRTFQTVQALGARLGVATATPQPEGREAALIAAILAGADEVALICWEHHRIPALAQAIPTADATAIPAAWPDDRFDLVWTFTLDGAGGRYTFSQVPQRLLAGDADGVAES
jgi:hypothetical protein